jgi:hypothetical protein
MTYSNTFSCQLVLYYLFRERIRGLLLFFLLLFQFCFHEDEAGLEITQSVGLQ